MKKVISLALSILMVLTAFPCISVLASAEDTDIKSISYTPANPEECVFIENTGGYFTMDNNMEEYYYYWCYPQTEGSILTVNYNDGRTVDYVCSVDENWSKCFISADGEKIEAVYFGNNQEESHWLPGKDNYLSVYYCDCETKIPITVKENPVKSISYTPAKSDSYVYIENTNGQISTDVNGQEYFDYWLSIFEGNILTVNYKDGRTLDYVYSHDEDWNPIYLSEDGDIINGNDVDISAYQYKNPWLAGKENYFTVSYLSAETKVPVTVIENPVKSISYTIGELSRSEFIENTNGDWDEIDGKEFFYYYCYKGEGDILTVNYKDGRTVNYIASYDDDWIFNYISENGEVISGNDVSLYDTQYQEPWYVGKDNYVTVNYLATETKVKITVKENPVKSISYTPVRPEDFEFIENMDGYISYDGDGEYFEYYVRRSEGDILTVNYNDGTKKDFVYSYNDDWDWFYTSADCEVIKYADVDFYDRQYTEHWLPGQENYIYVSYLGAETKIPVTIKENNVASIQFIPINPVTYMENSHGYFCNYNCDNEYFYYYTPTFKVGDILRIIDKKGAATDYTYKDTTGNADYAFVSKSGDKISQYEVTCCDNQYDRHWTAGTKNEYYIEYFNKTATVYVTITENPVKSISYSFGSKTINAETDGIYGIGEQGSAHFDFWAGTYPEAGAKLTLNLKNGTKETYTYNGEDYICGKKAIRGYDVRFRYDGTMYDEKSTAITVDVDYMGSKFTTSIPIAKSKVKSLEYIPAAAIVLETYKDTYGTQNDDGTFSVNFYGNPGDKIKINYTDGTNKTLVYEKDKGFCYPNGDYASISFSTDMQRLKTGKNTCYVEYSGKVASFAVTLKDLGFSSVKYVSASGSKCLYNNIEPEELENGKYRYMTYIFDVGDKIVLTGKDGTVKTYVYTLKDFGDQSEVYFVNEKDSDDCLYYGYIPCYVDVDTREPLKGKYNATLEFMGCKTTVPVELVANNVTGIDFVPVNKKINTFKDALSSRTYSIDNSKTHFYAYYSSSFNKGDVLKVTYSDGKTEQFTFDGASFKTASGKQLSGRITKSVSATSSDKSYTVSYAGAYRNCNFDLVDDVKSVAFVSEKDIVIESTKYTEKASFVTDDNDYVISSDVFKYYEEPNIFDYGYIKVTYTDGTTEIFKSVNGIFTDGTGKASKHGCTFDGFQYITHWKEGTGNYIYLAFMGRTVKIPVTVKKPCSHKYTATVVKPTCTTDGYTLHKCSLCGDSYKDTVVKAKGHTYKNGVCSVCCDWQYAKTAPTVKVSNTATGVGISWNKIAGATGYYVYRKTGTDGWTKIANIKSGSTVSYTDTTAKSGTKYYYCAKPYRGSVAGSFKSSSVLLYLATPTVKAANNAKGVEVSWNKIGGAKGYYVYRKTGTGGWTKIANIESGSTVSYTDTTAKSGTKYYYAVKAYNGSVTGSFKSSSVLLYLATPTVKAANNSKGVGVSWNKIGGAKGYYVYRKTGTGGWTKIANIKSGSTVSYTDTTAKSGTKYYYCVKAYNGSVTGNIKSSSAVVYLKAVTLSSATSGKTGITVKWGKVYGAKGYYVYRKTGSGSYAKIANIKSGSTVNYLDKSAKKGTTYTYCVKAYNGSFASAYANTKACKDKY